MLVNELVSLFTNPCIKFSCREMIDVDTYNEYTYYLNRSIMNSYNEESRLVFSFSSMFRQSKLKSLYVYNNKSKRYVKYKICNMKGASARIKIDRSEKKLALSKSIFPRCQRSPKQTRLSTLASVQGFLITATIQ